MLGLANAGKSTNVVEIKKTTPPPNTFVHLWSKHAHIPFLQSYNTFSVTLSFLTIATWNQLGQDKTIV